MYIYGLTLLLKTQNSPAFTSGSRSAPLLSAGAAAAPRASGWSRTAATVAAKSP